MTDISIRSYERKELPLEKRLPSLARRFPSLNRADGVDPWDPEKLNRWVEGCDDPAAEQAGLLLLGLAGIPTSKPFDVLVAMGCWSDDDRQMFVNFLRIWDF